MVIVNDIPNNCLDLALLKVDPPFEFSNKINQIALNDVEKNLEGRKLEISGWGKTENELHPKRLRKTTVIVTEHPLKDTRMTEKHGYGIGMSFQQNTGLCNGDSGGKTDFNETILLVKTIWDSLSL